MRLRRLQLMTAALAAVALLTLVGIARADGVADARKAIRANYHEMDVALSAKDGEGGAKYYDGDCSVIMIDGNTVTVDQMRTGIGHMLSLFKTASSSQKITKFSTANKDGVENATASVTQTVVGVAFRHSGEKLNIKFIQTRRDYWEKSDNGWSIKQTRVLMDIGYKNGKRTDKT